MIGLGILMPAPNFMMAEDELCRYVISYSCLFRVPTHFTGRFLEIRIS